MTEYYTTVGLEIHAELKTKSKMFCGCKNDPEETKPNQNICPVCLAHPGTLPVINKEAIKSIIKVGLSIGSDISDEFTEFDRKNYFYPDIPKGYQISQYKYPIVVGGELSGVKITRIHLEEDTATSKHDRGNYSLVDFNRAGVPLMELVTEPVIHTAEIAGAFAREYQLLLRTLGVSDANMEKGQMRVDVNVSISPDPQKFGPKVEVKNVNSFRSVEKAIAYEVERMKKLHEEDKANEIVQETRGWNEVKEETYSQRTKENAQDYRYFPDPDLPKLVLKKVFNIPELLTSLPELPETKRFRYKEFGIKDADIELFVTDPELSLYFETVVSKLEEKNKMKETVLVANYIISDLLGLKKKDPAFVFPKEEYFGELMNMLGDGLISSRTAKDLLPELSTLDRSPKEIAEERGLIQKNDPDTMKHLIEKIISDNPSVVEQYKGGKESAIMFLVGQVMKEGKGAVNPSMAKELLENALKG
jgi:aspartyl-tRNA(Asn)/glutamyl-tRNA(Gln) amidotransferase subunit B